MDQFLNLNVHQVLTHQLKYFGIAAPWFSWVAAVLLIIWPSYHVIRLLLLWLLQKLRCKKLEKKIRELRAEYPLRGSSGLNAVAIDSLDQIFTSVPFFTNQWHIIRSKLIYKRTPGDDNEQVWTIESASSVFREDNFLGNSFDKRHFLAIPAIITSIGLLMTFVAILAGLLDVHYIEVSKTVEGLGNLISGLSGKFISSVAALFAATVFMLIEKPIFHSLNRIRFSLTTALDTLIPLRSESHILEEISQNISEQTNAFKIFNSDLSLKLRNSFSESMGPTLDRMVDAIDKLNQLTDSSKAELLEAIQEMNQLLKRSEQTRQDSISGHIEVLIENLQKSISESIGIMSNEFSKSLTGTTQDQFKKVAESVGATANVLENMNKQFSNNQSEFQELIKIAKQSTESQLSNSSAIIERMVKVLGITMAELVGKVDELSTKMATTIESSAKKSSSAAESIIGEMKDLNSQSADRLYKILDKHEQQMDKVDDFKKTLHDAIGEFGEYVTGYNEINRNLQNLSTSATAVMERLNHSTQQIKECQDSFMRIADTTSSKIKLLAESNEGQTKIWNDINVSMEQYKKTFQDVESSAKNLLSTISQHLQVFSEATQEHFNQTISVANDHVNMAVNKLATSIDELSAKLDDLSEIVSEIEEYHNRTQR